MKYLLKNFLLLSLFFVLQNTLFASPLKKTGYPLPSFNLPSLFDNHTRFTNQDLKGHVALLNIWASWCDACRAEHAILMKIKNQYHVPIYGINYKDNEDNARNWLKIAGNPYILIGVDQEGVVADRLDVYGTPETYLIDTEGKIRYRYLGALDENTWKTVLLPLMKQYMID